ncbi:bifunctional phosphopantothenoylcysteine decarboxylase/phosphopantothenate--cysteine ligase CoaBC [Aquiluna sp.]|nr:bifunctional phosphopantothenoylcysteine decarboxylase/phosphopantothenate--cysteine ligase CoaBC [Aquiluna sp.]
MRILLGITGGIAAYKAAGLLRAMSELGHEVTALPTQNALRFIGEATLEALSGKNIDSDLYGDVASVRHVQLGQEADLIVIAPATAAFLGRYAAGIADDLLLNALLASTAEVVVVPAMHTEMWQNQATIENVETLRSRGIRVMEPASGRLTGEDTGPGRLPEVEDIIEFLFASSPLTGKTVTVTAGGTREHIDDVRFIGNRSSGKTGIALALAARDLGAKVRLIACNLAQTPKGMDVTHVESVADLSAALQESSDVLVMAAAVSDFQVANPHKGKLSRSTVPELKLSSTPDLLAAYTKQFPKSFAVGFALVDQEEDVVKASRSKLETKGAKVVIGNSVSSLEGSDTVVQYVDADSEVEISGTKDEVAREIIRRVAAQLS